MPIINSTFDDLMKGDSRNESMYEVEASRCMTRMAISWRKEMDKIFTDLEKPMSTVRDGLFYGGTWTTLQLVNGYWAARNDHIYKYATVLVGYPILHGAFYFEVRVLKAGSIQIGWTSKLTIFDKLEGFENDLWSAVCTLDLIAVDTIVGSLLDIEKQKVKFYLNGQLQKNIKVKESFFDYTPFFATVCFSPGQTVLFNIGQEPFKYWPNDKVDSIHNSAQKMGLECRLIAPIESRGTRMHEFDYSKLPLIELPPLFHDAEQRKVDYWVRKEAENIVKGGGMDDETLQRLREWNVRDWCRPMQSMVEVLGEGLDDDQVPALVYWMSQVIVSISCASQDNEQYTLFSHYQRMPLTSANWQRHRQFAIVLANWPYLFYFDLYLSYFDEQLCYLLKILDLADDCWTQLYTLLTLKRLTEDQVAIETLDAAKAIKLNRAVVKRITTWASEFDDDDETKLKLNKNAKSVAARLQRYLLAKSLLEIVKMEENLPPSWRMHTGAERHDKGITTSFRLSAQDRSLYLQLSPSGLMARCDFRWQSVRSEFTINPGTFYFEVTILTPGPMRIGLAVRQMEIEKRNRHNEYYVGTQIGSNALSIGFDGYHGCVWMHDRQYQPKSPLSRWRVGDVVGVYFDTFARLVTFTLNEKIIELTADLFAAEFIFSKLETHVALTLYAHQQVYCNFQCTTIPPVLKGHQSIQINITNSNLTSTMLLANSQLTCQEAVNLLYHQAQPSTSCLPPFHSSPSLSFHTPIPDVRLCRVLATLLVSTDSAKLNHNMSPPILNDLESIILSMQQQHQGHDDQDAFIHLLSEQMKRQIREIKGDRKMKKSVRQREDEDEK